MDTSNRQTHKRTFSESDSVSRTERYLCTFTHLWIINYLSSYIDDPNSLCLQSETFSPAHTPYSNTRWSLKLYPRGLNEKQHSNQNLAIFLKYVSGTIPTIKAKAEFSVISRSNDLVLLRSTNFHTFSSGNDWGYSEFLDGSYLNSRRNELLTEDRLRVYVRVLLVDEKESLPIEPSTSSSTDCSRLFPTEKDRFEPLDLLSSQIQTLFDEQRSTDLCIHVVPKQDHSLDEQRRTSLRRTTRSTASRMAQRSCSTSLEQEKLSDLRRYSHLTPLATFHVHRSILIARSSLFANQIRSRSSPSHLYIDDLQPLTVRTMLIYIYTGRLPVIGEESSNQLDLLDLYRASVKYNLHQLRDLSKKTMLDQLKIENAMEILQTSDQANDPDLKQQILSFVRSHASAIAKTSNWLDCTKQNPQLLIDAFRSLVTASSVKHSSAYQQTLSLTTTKHSN